MRIYAGQYVMPETIVRWCDANGKISVDPAHRIDWTTVYKYEEVNTELRISIASQIFLASDHSANDAREAWAAADNFLRAK